MDSNIAGGNNAESMVSTIYLFVREFFSKYGWPLLFVLFLMYYFKPQIKNLQHNYSLQRANNPYRVKILDEDMKRVRTRQQLEHYKALEKSSTPIESEGVSEGS